MENKLAIFEGHKIRRLYDDKTETWFFSVVDVLQVLIQQPDYQMARKYWNKLKERLKAEGSQTVTNCHQLKMTADDVPYVPSKEGRRKNPPPASRTPPKERIEEKTVPDGNARPTSRVQRRT